MDSFIAVKDAERRHDPTIIPSSHTPSPSSSLSPHSITPHNPLPSPTSSGDTTAWDLSHSLNPPTTHPSPPHPSLIHRASDQLHAMGAAVRERVEALASHHHAYQRESDVPNQRTGVVVDVKRTEEVRGGAAAEWQQGMVEKEQDRSYQAPIV